MVTLFYTENAMARANDDVPSDHELEFYEIDEAWYEAYSQRLKPIEDPNDD